MVATKRLRSSSLPLDLLSLLTEISSAHSQNMRACCQDRARNVPVVTYAVDIGLPLLLLLVSFLYLRSRSSSVENKNSVLPLLHEGERAKPAFSPLPLDTLDREPTSSTAPTLLKRSLDWLAGEEGPAETSKKGIEDRLAALSSAKIGSLLAVLQTSPEGLSAAEAAARLEKYGPNKVTMMKPPGLFKLAFHSIWQPFNGLMLVLAVITICPPISDGRTFALIMVFLLGAVLLRFMEEVKSARNAEATEEPLITFTRVSRGHTIIEVNTEEWVPGDIIYLSGSDLVPSDVRILEAQHLQIGRGMSSLTGEVTPVTRLPVATSGKGTVLEHVNIALKGTSVISGSAKCLVVGTGTRTYVAGIAATIPSGRPMNAFDYSIRRVVYLFIVFLGFIGPIVIIVSGLSTGSWSTAVALGLSVAVGLSPQMMPG